MSILVIGTLDTKGPEVGYLRDQVIRHGGRPLVIDPGILGDPATPADVSRQEVARAAGVELAGLIAGGDRQRCQAAMIEGLAAVVTRLHAEGRVDGVVGVGGAQGTAMATAAMRALPVGIPKVMVSTVACGNTAFGPYVGTKDVTMLHSVADILGLNRVTRRILAQAAAAVVGMASVEAVATGDRELVAITQAGITTLGVLEIKERLENLDFEVIAFHCNGIGGKAMEEMILEGVIQGVIDYSPHEIVDYLYGGLMPALPDRLLAAGQRGIPQVVVPGGTDIRLYGVGGDLPEELRQRLCVQHTPTHTHVRSSAEEMSGVAHFIAERLNGGRGPRAVLLPLRGFSMNNKPGGPLYDAEANQALVNTLRDELTSEVRLVEIDAHINDPEFAALTVETFLILRTEAMEKRR
jgi:uncharacterized protein (UPF0261 family)